MKEQNSKERNPLAIEIGKRISECRKALKLTQEQLEERSGVSQNHISSLERGKSMIGAEALIKLAPALNVTSDYILTGKHGSELSLQLEQQIRWAGNLTAEEQERLSCILKDIRELMS